MHSVISLYFLFSIKRSNLKKQHFFCILTAFMNQTFSAGDLLIGSRAQAHTVRTKTGTPGIPLLYGWSHPPLPLLHAFHMWKHFIFLVPCSLRFTVCLKCEPLHSSEKAKAVRTEWSSMKIVIIFPSAVPLRAFRLELSCKTAFCWRLSETPQSPVCTS